MDSINGKFPICTTNNNNNMNINNSSCNTNNNNNAQERLFTTNTITDSKMKMSSSASASTSSSVIPSQSDNNPQRNEGELRPLDRNLTSLCDHIQMQGFDNGAFSDIVLQAMGSTFRLHRLILSRSSYFRNMLQGPWKEAYAPVVALHIDDDNVNEEALTIALAYLYGDQPELNDTNAFRVLAAASFLDLQDLCIICTDFIISELWRTNFLEYQAFAESQDYGKHGERVRRACWGYLCQSGYEELREMLPKLSSQTLLALLTSDQLWVPNEEKRFELALLTMLKKCALQRESCSEDSYVALGRSLRTMMGFEDSVDIGASKQCLGHVSLQEKHDTRETVDNLLLKSLDLSGCVRNLRLDSAEPNIMQLHQDSSSKAVLYSSNNLESIPRGCSSSTGAAAGFSGYTEIQNETDAGRNPIKESNASYPVNDSEWIPRDQEKDFSLTSSCMGSIPKERAKNVSSQPPSWGRRIVGRRQVESSAKDDYGIHPEDYDAFVGIFEGGSLLYCNMSFEVLLNGRKHLEELGFPCRAVSDGLWLQVLLGQKVQEFCVGTCKFCSLTSSLCTCRQQSRYSQCLSSSPRFYRQEHDRNALSSIMGDSYLAEAQGEGSGLVKTVRVHVQGPVDGLAGIGRGTSFVPAPAWPPTRYVFSRVPFGATRNGQQSHANDDSEARVDLGGGDLSGDGLTALVGLSQGNNVIPVQAAHSERVFEADQQSSLSCSSCIPMQLREPLEQSTENEWEDSEGSSILLDMTTPLCNFPPFRFGVEFEDVHRLDDGLVKHSQEVFYAGSLWKVSVQAFSLEDHQGRRTLGLFLHRRKAESSDPFRKGYPYVDHREKVYARFQLICPSKRDVMVFGNIKQRGTLLPKAPKGWGWRTAFLFDELPDLLHCGALRVAAVVQLV